MSSRTSAAYAAITACLFLAIAGCSSSGTGKDTEQPSATASTDLDFASKRWKNLDGEVQNLVCLQALERGGPDYQGMLNELTKAGMPQPDAAAMLPYAANECT